MIVPMKKVTLVCLASDRDDALLRAYSATALKRVWSSVRTSWYLTNLLHRFPSASEFDQRAQENELDYLKASAYAHAALAEQYAGMPLEGLESRMPAGEHR